MVEIIEQHLFTEQQIINCLNTIYGIKVVALTFIPLGADIDAKVYKAQTDDQSSYFVKIKCGYNHDIGAIIQQLFYDAGITSIIAPIKTILGQITYHIDNFTIIRPLSKPLFTAPCCKFPI